MDKIGDGGKRRATAARLAMPLLLGMAALLSACGAISSANRALGSGLIGGALTPGSDIEQTYYLGNFDPRGQLPPSIYRIRVRGQASALSATRFASSWVPADVVDSLTGIVSNDAGRGDPKVTSDPNSRSTLAGAGRPLVMFGPEGFREAPRNHRLVVLMGSNPEAVEQAFASALGTLATVRFGQSGANLERSTFTLLIQLGQEREQLKAIQGAR